MENHNQQSTLVSFDIYDEIEFPSIFVSSASRETLPQQLIMRELRW